MMAEGALRGPFLLFLVFGVHLGVDRDAVFNICLRKRVVVLLRCHLEGEDGGQFDVLVQGDGKARFKEEKEERRAFYLSGVSKLCIGSLGWFVL